MAQEKSKSNLLHKVMSVVGLILCVIFGFMLICNLTIIVKGTLHPEMPPSVLGKTPLVVQSGSMSGTAEDHIEVGDLIFVVPAAPEELQVGDIIAFKEGSGLSVTTHRIVKVIEQEDGGLAYTTKGDANNTVDQEQVTEERLVGVYESRIPKVGDFAMFLQTPLGMIVFIGVPLLAFILYDVIRRQRYANRENAKTAELEAELARLRAMQSPQANGASAESGTDTPEK